MHFLFRQRTRSPFILLVILIVVDQCTSLISLTTLLYKHQEQDGLFSFAIPKRYENATLGPETFDWLVRIYGLWRVIRSHIRRAPSDSHVCSNGGWCRLHCRQFEQIDWTRKDICGTRYCCQRKAISSFKN